MTSPISLILTTHNRDRHLPTAIASILNQTYPHFELLLWDDGSTDQTLEVIQQFSDPRIRIIAAPHQGRGIALQQAIAQTTHSCLCWVDSDDFLAPTALEETIAILDTHPDVGMVYTDHWIIDAHNQIQGIGKRCQIPYSCDRLLIDFMTFHFRLIRRCLYDQVGGIDPSFTYAQDYDLCLKLSEVTQIYHHEHPLYYYRTHAQSISQGKRAEQLDFSRQAVCNALQRRGLSRTHELSISRISQFTIQKRC
jgi:glycosyltransferase involved in cell wall biosynthesis